MRRFHFGKLDQLRTTYQRDGLNALVGKVWYKGIRMLTARTPTLQNWFAEHKWQLIEAGVSGKDVHTYHLAWGEARRAFYEKWHSVPCSPAEVRRLQSLKNAYQGHRIFILGNGPSLNQTPLEKLANEYTFGVNRIYLLFDRISWRPTFYTSLDWRVTPDIAHEINALTGMTFFFPQRYWGLLRQGADVYWYRSTSCAHAFSPDINRYLCGGGTISVTAIQLAFYMGFDPIYLIGMDMNYIIPDTVKQSGPDQFGTGTRLYLEGTQDDDPNHFDPRYFGKGRHWHDPNIAGMVRGYEQCRQALEARGRQIYNATVGGKLDVFERVDIHTLV